MKLFARALLVVALCLPTFAHAAATPESLAAATRLLESMDMQATLDKSIELALDMQIKAQPALEPYRGVMEEFFHKYMSYEALKPQLAQQYAEVFTAAELDELTKFYASPTGRKALELVPSLMQKGGEIGQAQVEAHMPELLKMIQDQTDRMKAAEPASKVSTTPAPEKPAQKP
jgi:hypothetical protein